MFSQLFKPLYQRRLCRGACPLLVDSGKTMHPSQWSMPIGASIREARMRHSSLKASTCSTVSCCDYLSKVLLFQGWYHPLLWQSDSIHLSATLQALNFQEWEWILLRLFLRTHKTQEGTHKSLLRLRTKTSTLKKRLSGEKKKLDLGLNQAPFLDFAAQFDFCSAL